MKKIFVLILCGVLMLFITGCGNNETTMDKNNDNSNNNVQESENKEGYGEVVCKGKSNDFANILDEGIISATRIETFKVENNVITDHQVNVEVEVDKDVYSKSDVDNLVQTQKYGDYTTSKKSDYVLNFEYTGDNSHGITWESDDMINEITRIMEGSLYSYTCEVK